MELKKRIFQSCIYCVKNNSRKHILNDYNEKYFFELSNKCINQVSKKRYNYIKNEF